MAPNYGCGRITGALTSCGYGSLCLACRLNVGLEGLLRECVPYVQRGRFGNPPADELLGRLYAVLGEPEVARG